MDNQIVCKIELFDNSFNVFVCRDGIIKPVKIPAANAYIGLVKLCREEEIYNLALKGDKTFLDGFIEQIYTEEATLFGHTGKINIEVL